MRVFFMMTALLFATLLFGATYTCPMHPQIVSDHPGTCPICGMDLVARDLKPLPLHSPEKRSPVMLSEGMIQTMGVRSEAVRYSEFGRHIRAFGVVEPNERMQKRLSLRVAGWIEALYVNAVGDTVSEGMVLFELYAPELIEAQNDYLGALASGEKRRIAASAMRLEGLGVDARVLRRLQKERSPLRNVPFYARSSAQVTTLQIAQGSYVTPGKELMRLDDLSSVWVRAMVDEQDALYVAHGTRAHITQQELGKLVYDATVDFVYPTIDSASRMVPVRLELPNPRYLLRPGGVVDVVFASDYDRRLSVPSTALLHRSDGTFVVVSLGAGHFEPRRVESGFESAGRVAIVSGVQEGEAVVTSGAFLIDSESALRDAMGNMGGAQHDHADH